MNSLLIPFGKIYGFVMNVRNALYDCNFFRVHDLGAKTISIGNLTTGGTGKTPLVAMIAEFLAEKGETVCILTRGYGRKNANDQVVVSDGRAILTDAKTGGDEPVELARNLSGKAVIIADADRVAAGVWAHKQFGITAFILDDGFQHRRVKRDIDIVCIDASNPFGGNAVLPCGKLREPIENLQRADVVVITRSNLSDKIEDLKFEISKLNPKAKVFLAHNTVKRLLPFNEFLEKKDNSVQDRIWDKLIEKIDANNVDNEVRIAAFCALGNPDNFFLQLMKVTDEINELDLSIIKSFPDHHFYSQRDIDHIEKQAKDCNIDALITTAKDAVKLSNLKFTIPCYVVEIEMEIADSKAFRDLLVSF